MPERRFPFRKKVTDLVAHRIEQVVGGEGTEVQRANLYLVQELGPTLFIVREETSQSTRESGEGEAPATATSSKKYKVAIGDMQRCTCGDSDICVHILFVMIKLLRVPKNNPLVWQHSLMDREVNDILAGVHREQENARRRPTVRQYLRRSSTPSSVDGGCGAGSGAKRRELEEGDTCPVCLDDLSPTDKQLTYCSKGCGKQAHAKCMKMYAEHNQSVGKKVTCPLCRVDWGPMAVHDLRKEVAGVANHPKVRCSHCPNRQEIVGVNYRCLVCAQYDMCDRCFRGTAVHAQHPFVKRDAPGQQWAPAPRIRRRGSVGEMFLERQQGGGSSTAHLSLIRQLQDIQAVREFTAEDYELLQQLDHTTRAANRRSAMESSFLYDDTNSQNPTMTLKEYLTQFVTSGMVGSTRSSRNSRMQSSILDIASTGTSCMFCSGRMSQSGTNLSRLPCGHWLHESCVQGFIDGGVTECRLKCLRCEQLVFPGLRSRKRRGGAPRSGGSSNSAATNPSSAVIREPLVLSATGLNIAGNPRSDSSGSGSPLDEAAMLVERGDTRVRRTGTRPSLSSTTAATRRVGFGSSRRRTARPQQQNAENTPMPNLIGGDLQRQERPASTSRAMRKRRQGRLLQRTSLSSSMRRLPGRGSEQGLAELTDVPRFIQGVAVFHHA